VSCYAWSRIQDVRLRRGQAVELAVDGQALALDGWRWNIIDGEDLVEEVRERLAEGQTSAGENA
jgi:hypothetical protein